MLPQFISDGKELFQTIIHIGQATFIMRDSMKILGIPLAQVAKNLLKDTNKLDIDHDELRKLLKEYAKAHAINRGDIKSQELITNLIYGDS
jgi:hypothetical protein